MTDAALADRRLVGRSFRGHALQRADFTKADLRAADFTGADLRGASFRGAKLGVAPRVGAAILGTAIAIAIGAGLTIGWAVDDLRERISSDEWDQVAEGGTLAVTLLVLVAVIIWRGFDLAFKAVGVVYLVLLLANMVGNAIWDEVEWDRIAGATALLIVLVLAVTAGILGRVIGGVFGSWSIAIVALLGGLASGRTEGGIAGVIVALALVVISKRAVRGDPRDRTLRRIAHHLVRRWGTQFVNADLTGADFSGVNVSRCDVRGATVVDVAWDPDHPRPVDLPTESASTS
ncbi:MAG: pentapeptide repeat-containing protein [Acidimicrobiales bacterium]